ncbi:hypothetical protein EXIGLDRAFT_837549 [Exidia glandulosa HHB12029]|uniref:PLP-dependent transferase n=1 Tax=Exidia glandulosa HHB12029 TaxID=1314781 RepID=A0A165GNQ9_EXIGL|nr:hypothetical protein EXIGLDRAFT_837549 [Exidia glandulosa HHB12029]
MDIEEFRKQGYAAIDRICDYYATLEERPVVSQVEPGYLRKLLPESVPEEGEPMEQIAQSFQDDILPGITHWQHPSFFAYFPSNATFESMLGEMYATCVNNPGFNWTCSPAATELEGVVMDWAAKMLGLQEDFLHTSGKGGGVMQTTASDSALTAVVAARSRYQRAHPDISLDKLVVYTTTQTHSLGAKAALVLGLSIRALPVEADDQYALRGEVFKAAVEEDKLKGRHPFILIATVGTTSSGAVDRLDEIVDVGKDYPDIWIHVDAAWAGVALACPEFREQAMLEHINAGAHSFCTNFHKWGLTHFDASTLWVRNRALLTTALDITPEFLRTKAADTGLVIDYRNWHLALGRRFRSLKLWFVLRAYGLSGFQAHIRKGVAQAQLFASLIQQSPYLQIFTPPSLSLVVFRLRDSDEAANRVFFGHLADRADVYLTHTEMNGKFCVRFAVGGVHTEEKHIRHAFEVVEEVAKRTIEERGLGVSLEAEAEGRTDN